MEDRVPSHQKLRIPVFQAFQELGGDATQTEIVCKVAKNIGLSGVHRQTAHLKSNHPGLSSAAMMAYLRTMPYAKAREALIAAGAKSRLSGMAAPILSNLGVFQGEMRFGDAVVTDILPLLPAMHAPAFMLGASSYAGVLTLSAGFYAEEREASEVERLLADIREKLLQRAT